MSEQPNLPAMRPLDEVIHTNRFGKNTYYSHALNMDHIKILHEKGIVPFDTIIKIHIEDGNIETLNKILKITDNHWTVLEKIIEYSISSKNMDIYNFINYLKLFLNSSGDYTRFINKYDNQTTISEFCKELYKDTPCQNDLFNFIYTCKSYENGINEDHVSLEHLLATIEKFSPPDIKSGGERK
jgi:hypothetical protein